MSQAFRFFGISLGLRLVSFAQRPDLCYDTGLMHTIRAKLQGVTAQITGRPGAFSSSGIVVALKRRGEELCVANGHDANGSPVTEETPFCIASASKMAIALAALRLVSEERLGLDEPLRDVLPRARAERATLRQLLTHTAGLPIEVQLPYDERLTREEILNACLDSAAVIAPGTNVQYSNVGYALIAMAMEERCKLDLPEILREYVFEPLGVDAWIGSSPFAAAVDGIDSQYAGTWLEPYGPFWRSLMLPWACLTMRAQQLLQLVQAFGDREFLGSAFDQASRPHTSDLPGGFVDSSPFLGHRSTKTLSWKKANWGLGVEFPGEKRPHYAPALASSNSFGHIGSSGVLAWCDPEYDTAWAICGCRTTDSGWLMRWSPAIGTICLGDIQQLPKGA